MYNANCFKKFYNAIHWKWSNPGAAEVALTRTFLYKFMSLLIYSFILKRGKY